jgi:hypothetical protein
MKQYKIGDSLLIYGGANHHGRGKQIARIFKITNKGTIYCEKYSRSGKLVAKNHRLDPANIVELMDQ